MIRTLRSNINLNEKLIDINFGSRFFIFEFHEILLCSNSRYKRNILHALFTKLCLFIGDLIRWFVAFWFSAEARFLCREKKRIEAHQGSLLSQPDWILTPRISYRGFIVLSQACKSNRERSLAFFEFHRPGLSTVDHVYPDVCPNFFVYFTGDPYSKTSLDNLLRPLRVRKPHTPKTHKILLKLSHSALDMYVTLSLRLVYTRFTITMEISFPDRPAKSL